MSTRRAPIGPSGLLTTAIARSATLGARVATAEIKAAQSWAGSRSDSSSVSHAEASPQPWTQSATRAVLPDPAGATKAVTGYAARSSNSSTSRVRRTKWSGALGIAELGPEEGGVEASPLDHQRRHASSHAVTAI